MRPDLNANTSSSNPEIQRRYEQQRNNPAAPPEPAHVPAPVPQIRARSPQRLQPEIELDTDDDDSQQDVQSDTHSEKRQREEALGDDGEPIRSAKKRRIEAESEEVANMQLVSRDEVLSTESAEALDEVDVAETELTLSQQLHATIVTGDLTALKRILALDEIDLNAMDARGLMPLLVAVKTGRLEIVQALLDKGAEPDTVDDKSRNTLMLAAKNGYGDVVSLLLSLGLDIDERDSYERTALHLAAATGRDAVVNILLSKGADLGAVDTYGSTPLMYAAREGHESVVTLLLNAGAVINHKDGEGWTALMCAVRGRCSTIVQVLLNQGACPHAVNDRRNNALMFAAATGDNKVLSVLLAAGAQINTANCEGRTPLMFAADAGHAAIVEILLAGGADLHAVSSENQNALTLAADNGHGEVVKLLLEAGVDFDLADNIGMTALLYATQKAHTAIAQALLNKGANPNQRNKLGNTALNLAVYINQEDLASRSLLLFDIQELAESLPLYKIDIKEVNLPLVESLLSHGAEPIKPPYPVPPLVADLFRHRGLLKPELAIETLAPDLQTVLQNLFSLAAQQTVDANTIIRQALENAGVCSPIVQQLMQYFGDIPALWQTLAGTGQVASAAQKSLSIAGAFAQLDAWVKNWPEGYDPYQGQGLSDITAARCTALLKHQVAQLVAIAHDKEMLTLAAGLNNLLPLCVQHTQGDAQSGFHVNQQDLSKYLHQALGLYGLLAEQVATAWSNTLTDQQSVLSALTGTQAAIDFDDVLPAFARQLKLMDAANGHSLLRITEAKSINTDAYADLMYRQLHMLSQYWTQASAGSRA